MTNEWLEYKAYTDTPVFLADSKQSTAFMSRFSTTIIKKNKGFNRIFTILSRGHLFHNADGTLRTDAPYEAVTNKALKFHTSFPELHSEFPDIVDKNGAGWYYRYLHSLSDYIKKNKDDITKKLHCFAEKKTLKAIEDTWSRKLIQFQYSVYNDRSSTDFPLLFDTAIADALVLGPLRTEAVVLSDETLNKIKAYQADAKTEKLMITLAVYYIANKEPDCEWVIMPRTNISAYLGSASYMEMYESRKPEGFMEKKPEIGGVSAVKKYITKNLLESVLAEAMRFWIEHRQNKTDSAKKTKSAYCLKANKFCYNGLLGYCTYNLEQSRTIATHFVVYLTYLINQEKRRTSRKKMM